MGTAGNRGSDGERTRTTPARVCRQCGWGWQQHGCSASLVVPLGPVRKGAVGQARTARPAPGEGGGSRGTAGRTPLPSCTRCCLFAHTPPWASHRVGPDGTTPSVGTACNRGAPWKHPLTHVWPVLMVTRRGPRPSLGPNINRGSGTALPSLPAHPITTPHPTTFGWDPLPSPHPVHPAHSPTDAAPCPPLCAFPTPLALLPSTDAAAMARSSTARFSGAALCMAMVAVMLVLLVPASCDAAAGPPRRGGPIVAEAPARPGADGGGEVATTDRSAPANEPSGCSPNGLCFKWYTVNSWCFTAKAATSGPVRCQNSDQCSSNWVCCKRCLRV